MYGFAVDVLQGEGELGDTGLPGEVWEIASVAIRRGNMPVFEASGFEETGDLGFLGPRGGGGKPAGKAESNKLESGEFEAGDPEGSAMRPRRVRSSCSNSASRFGEMTSARGCLLLLPSPRSERVCFEHVVVIPC